MLGKIKKIIFKILNIKKQDKPKNDILDRFAVEVAEVNANKIDRDNNFKLKERLVYIIKNTKSYRIRKKNNKRLKKLTELTKGITK